MLKRVIFISSMTVLLAQILWPSHLQASTTWQQTSGPEGEKIRALAVDPVTPQTLYAGTNSGVFISTNGGSSWSISLTINSTVVSLAIAPTTPQTVYAGTGSGVHRSTDGGGSWSVVNSGLTVTNINTLAVNPTDSQMVYAGTSSGIFKSSNGGDSWILASDGLIGTNINALAVNPTTPQTVYAGTTGGGVFKSTNGGSSWSEVNNGLIGTDFFGLPTNTTVLSLAIDPTTPQTIYAGIDSSGGVFKSTNGGSSWSTANNGLPVTYGPAGSFTFASVVSLVIDPVTPQTVYAATDSGVFKSINSGGFWIGVNSGLNILVSSLAINRATPQTVYAGTYGGGVFKTTNGGGSWDAVNSGLAKMFTGAVAIDPSNILTVYAGTEGGGVFKSDNGGGSWSVVNSGLAHGGLYVNDLAISPSSTQTLYAATSGGFFKSTNGGTTWSTANSGLLPSEYCDIYQECFTPVISLMINPTTPLTIYAGTEYGVFRSINGGGSWSAVNSGMNNSFVYALAINLGPPQTIYAGTGDGVFRSIDGGDSWESVNNGLGSTFVYSLVLDQTTPQTLYAGTSGGVYKSTDGGGTWNMVNNGLTFMNIQHLTIDPANAQTIYAGTYGGGVFKTTNGGGSWDAVNSGLSEVHVLSLAINPTTPQTIYAGTRRGVFKALSSDYATLTVFKSGSGTGGITSAPAGISCGATCGASFAAGSTINLTATPASGSTFAGWTGACSGTGPCSVTMDASKSAGAVFDSYCVQYKNWCMDCPPPTTNLCRVGSVSAYTGDTWVCSDSTGSAACQVNRIKDGKTDYYIAGNVMASDVSNLGFSGANVTLKFPDSSIAQVAVTDGSGNFEFKGGVPAGEPFSFRLTTNYANLINTVQFSIMPESISILLPTVNGVCGTAHSNASTSAPASNLCTSGMASSVTGTGPWSWNCTGSLGAVNVTCSASLKTWPITLAIDGSGSGTVNGGMSCSSGAICPLMEFVADTNVILTQTPDFNSTFGGWSGACTNTTGNCNLTMNSAKSVTATFIAAAKVKIGTKDFTTLQAAYDDTATTNGSVIKLLEGALANTLTAGRGIEVKLEGGYNATYSGISSETVIQGPIKVRAGTVRIKGVKVR